jgi:hypothetical protein
VLQSITDWTQLSRNKGVPLAAVEMHRTSSKRCRRV